VGDDPARAVHLAVNRQATSGSGASSGEMIHITANHLWLTADRRWVQAGDLKPGTTALPPKPRPIPVPAHVAYIPQ
jgi:hypothetical protein